MHNLLLCTKMLRVRNIWFTFLPVKASHRFLIAIDVKIGNFHEYWRLQESSRANSETHFPRSLSASYNFFKFLFADTMPCLDYSPSWWNNWEIYCRLLFLSSILCSYLDIQILNFMKFWFGKGLFSRQSRKESYAVASNLPRTLDQQTSWFVLDVESSFLCEPTGVQVEIRSNIPPWKHVTSTLISALHINIRFLNIHLRIIKNLTNLPANSRQAKASLEFGRDRKLAKTSSVTMTLFQFGIVPQSDPLLQPYSSHKWQKSPCRRILRPSCWGKSIWRVTCTVHWFLSARSEDKADS